MKERKLLLGCIADDFTGAGDAASFLAGAGMDTVLVNEIPKEMPSRLPQAMVIALKTRTAKKEEAVQLTLAAARWLKRAGARQIYLKYCSTFDSTREGNIGPAADALMEELQVPYTILCPALPVNGRVVKEGKLYVNGCPLQESSMKNHPLTPMWDSRIKELMREQSRYPVYPITIDQVKSGDLAEEKKEHPHFYLVPDYTEDVHGEWIVKRYGKLPLLTGGSGLMAALGKMYVREHGSALHTEEMNESPGEGILLSGSCSEMTLKQIAYYENHGGLSLRISPEEVMQGEAEKKVRSFWKLHSKETILFYSSASAGEVRSSQSFGKDVISKALEDFMAWLAFYALENGKTRFIVAGGETSHRIIERYTPYLEMKAGSIAWVEYAPPGSEELFRLIREKVGESSTLILANHGAAVGGISILDAFYILEELEESAKIQMWLRNEKNIRRIVC